MSPKMDPNLPFSISFGPSWRQNMLQEVSTWNSRGDPNCIWGHLGAKRAPKSSTGVVVVVVVFNRMLELRRKAPSNVCIARGAKSVNEIASVLSESSILTTNRFAELIIPLVKLLCALLKFFGRAENENIIRDFGYKLRNS